MNILLITTIIGLVVGNPQFLDFIKKYNKTYDNEEIPHRLNVFLANLKNIDERNAKEGSNVYGVGPFTDLEDDEFNQMYTGWIPLPESAYENRVLFNVSTGDGDIDWREKKAITEIKDQGRCGSCWAFSATEAIESLAFLSGKYPLTKMSAQQITSCDKGSSGCNGGDPASGFKYVKSAGGLEKDQDYPYTSGGGSTGSCKFEKSKAYEQVTGYSTASGGEDGMLKALQAQPLSICHQTGGWRDYQSGQILKKCSSGGGHCTQLVGYSSEQGGYWIVKNSWGSSWGTNGYIYIAKGSNLCGISNHATWPQVN